MSKLIVNYGSINIDHVYKVEHFVQPGETLNSLQMTSGLGGKGANQSVAIARAGGNVMHVGQLSESDLWAKARLAHAGVNTTHIKSVEQASGHAIIQIEQKGENCILLHGGANQSCELGDLEHCLSQAKPTYLLLQNECNDASSALELAFKFNIKVVFNPAPMSANIMQLPLHKIDTLIVNEIEAQALSGKQNPTQMLEFFKTAYPETRVVLTLGAQGVIMLAHERILKCPAVNTSVIDTTGAGDTFVGYFLASLAAGSDDLTSLKIASAAAAITVSKLGAIDAIPTAAMVSELLND